MRHYEVVQTLHATQVAQTGVALAQSDLRHLRIDAIACYASTSLTLHSNLAQRLVASGGAFIRAESAKHAPARVGEAIVLPAGKLRSQYLIVGVTNQLRDAPTLASISSCIAAISARALQLGLRSLALPLLRVGRLLAPEDVLRAMLAPLFDHSSGPRALGNLLIVSDPDEPPSAMAWAAGFTRATFQDLMELGWLRAQAAALREIEGRLSATSALGPHAVDELIRKQVDLQQRIHAKLQRSLGQGRPGGQAIALELQRCDDERARLQQAMSGRSALERSVGA